MASMRAITIQAAVLVGLASAFVGVSERAAIAGGTCPACTFKKPNVMILLDYSSSMNNPYMGAQTQWEAALEAIDNLVTTNGGYYDTRLHLALMRFAHIGPFPNGQSLDVHWYDPAGDPQGYFECNGVQISAALAGFDPPLCNPGGPLPSGCSGSGSWTKGALDYARDVIVQTRADHPDDLDPGAERPYAIVLMSDGVWTGPEGGAQPPAENPQPTIDDLLDDHGVPTHVVPVDCFNGCAVPISDALQQVADAILQPLAPDCDDPIDPTGGSESGDSGSDDAPDPDPTTSGGAVDPTTDGYDDYDDEADWDHDDASAWTGEEGGDDPPPPMSTAGDSPPFDGSESSDPATDTAGETLEPRGCACRSAPSQRPPGAPAFVLLALIRRRRHPSR